MKCPHVSEAVCQQTIKTVKVGHFAKKQDNGSTISTNVTISTSRPRLKKRTMTRKRRKTSLSDAFRLLTWRNLQRLRMHYSLTLENGKYRAGVNLTLTKAVVSSRWCLKTML